jgi:hypothetical protein
MIPVAGGHLAAIYSLTHPPQSESEEDMLLPSTGSSVHAVAMPGVLLDMKPIWKVQRILWASVYADAKHYISIFWR